MTNLQYYLMFEVMESAWQVGRGRQGQAGGQLLGTQGAVCLPECPCTLARCSQG